MNKTVEQLKAEQEERMSEDEVLQIAYHRNGTGGDGFWVALVRVVELDHKVLVVIVPGYAVEGQQCPSGGMASYAIDPEMASGPWYNPGTIEFGMNSWRGDYYFELVVQAAKRKMENFQC